MLNFLALFRQNQMKQPLTFKNQLLITYATYTNNYHFIPFRTKVSPSTTVETPQAILYKSTPSTQS